MSFCPLHLLRVRVPFGLPSCVPRQSYRLQHLYRQRRAAPAASYFSDNAAQGNITASDTIINDLRIPSECHDSGSENAVPVVPVRTYKPRPTLDANQTNDPEHTAEPVHDNVKTPQPRRRRRRSPRVAYLRSQGTDATQDGVGRLLYVTPRVTGGVAKTFKYVGKELLEEERKIRSQSLLHDNLTLRKWRIVRNEIHRATRRGLRLRPRVVSPEKLALSQGDKDLLDKLRIDGQGSFRDAWEALGKLEKTVHWHRLSLWLLWHSPKHLPDFLTITCQNADKPVFAMSADCVLSLSDCHPEIVKKNPSFIKICLDPKLWPVFYLPQKAARLYMLHADRDEFYTAYNYAESKQLHIVAPTYLCYMKRFIEFQDIENAIKALESVRNIGHPDFLLNSPSVLRHCCKLLTLDSVENTGKGRNFRILPKLLELGIRPNRDMMNIVLSNAFKTGDPQVGLDILQYMNSQGFEADTYTYVTLLTDAVARQDEARVLSLSQEINARQDLRENAWIQSKLLHYQFLSRAKQIDPHDDPNEVFYSMLQLYNQLHDIAPLKDLTIIPPQYTPAGSKKSPPSLPALHIMIATYLRCQKNISSVQRVYAQFQRLTWQGHATIAPLAASDHTYNEFLVAFRNDPRGLRPAVRLVEDMLHFSNEASEQPEKKHIHAKPTAQTWTLLMSSFVYNKQSHAAEKVRAMMAKHGVQFNKVTWDMVIRNHVNTHNIPKIAKAVKEMESQGYTMDEHTLKTLRYLKDPERLWMAIEELDKLSDSNPSPTLYTPGDWKGAEALLEKGLRRLKRNMKSKA
ncbi:hypothetical protein ARAM_003008 [Aspergillus rambellii]|uniref:Pentatricopeptide repeat protein n=1 Tax=Aspergillus rambellii TaxID=308745 RepID=A0A0F8UFT0_9EURO|nr:hypothetical protein ARAM_003008 [Aspergillus rambellii]